MHHTVYTSCLDRDALIVPFVNCGTSVYAGFVVFCTLGYIAHEKNAPIEEVADQGKIYKS